MKREQATVSPEERRLHRISLGGILIFCVLGYLLYFASRRGEPPTWALTWVGALKPTLGALGTAARVSDIPFPAQVVIIYCAFGSILLAAWGTYLVFWVKKTREIILHRIGGHPRWKLVFWGFAYFVMVIPFVRGFIHEHPGSIGWQMHAFFSPSLGSATLLIGSYACLANVMPVALYWLWIGLTGHPQQNVTSSPINEPINHGSDAPTIVLKEGNHGQQG